MRQLDQPDEVAPAATTMAVEEILAGIDVERRPGFPMEGTQAHKLGRISGAASHPVAAPQVIQQRKTLFELFQFLVHGRWASRNRAYGETAQVPRQGWWVRK